MNIHLLKKKKINDLENLLKKPKEISTESRLSGWSFFSKNRKFKKNNNKKKINYLVIVYNFNFFY